MRVVDRMRDVRFAANAMKDFAKSELLKPAALGAPIAGLTSIIADASDEMLSSGKAWLIEFVSSDPRGHSGYADAYSFRTYAEDQLGNGTRALDLRFSSDQYFTSKRILRMAGVNNPLIRQEPFLAIWHRLAPDSQARLSRELITREKVSQTAAALALAVYRTKPVRSPIHFQRTGGDETVETNLFLASTLAIAAAVATLTDEEVSADEIYASSIAAVWARYRQIRAAVEEENAETALTGCYDALVCHLP